MRVTNPHEGEARVALGASGHGAWRVALAGGALALPCGAALALRVSFAPTDTRPHDLRLRLRVRGAPDVLLPLRAWHVAPQLHGTST